MELGFGEIIVVVAIVLLLFGPKKLPQLGDALGRGIRNFKDAMSGREPEERNAATPTAEPPPAAREGELPEQKHDPKAQPPNDRDVPVAR
jgi:sec-independent protein translocase protein TatA